jgi:lysophospholipid acyltransferase (LPLAT)-like uncharacterized protein
VAHELANAYRFDSLEKYGMKDRIGIRMADLIFFASITIIGRTIRWEISGTEHLEAIEHKGKVPIYCLWHDRIFAGTYFLRDRGIVVVTSQSLDGEYIARFLKRFGFGTIRGSSSRGSVRALVEAIRYVRRGLSLAFTVDGPRGPRYQVKPGPILLAKKTGNAILPFSVECSRFWKVKSWDRLQIPRPFTNARFMYGSPIYVPADADDSTLEAKRIELQHSLDDLLADGQAWRRSR